MKNILDKARNFWYYNKTMCIVLTLVLAAFLYVEFSGPSEKFDYSVGVISGRYYTEPEKAALKAALESCGKDLDGNGKVAADVTYYTVTLGAENQDESLIGGLDADLMMGVSGLFLLESPEAFTASTNGVKITEPLPVKDIPKLAGLGFDDLYAVVRTDVSTYPYYRELLSCN